jgi:hypothetical protein
MKPKKVTKARMERFEKLKELFEQYTFCFRIIHEPQLSHTLPLEEHIRPEYEASLEELRDEIFTLLF